MQPDNINVRVKLLLDNFNGGMMSSLFKSTITVILLLGCVTFSFGDEPEAVADAKRAIFQFCVERFDNPPNHQQNWLLQKYNEWKTNRIVGKCIDEQANALNEIDWESPFTETCVMKCITKKGNWDNVCIQKCIKEKGKNPNETKN